MRKIALGGAQFGLSYGIANQGGQAKQSEVSAILALASRQAIDTIDTAVSYGQSEAVLGQVGISDWKLISKLPPYTEINSDCNRWARAHVASSLARLRLNCLEGLLFHRGSDLLAPSGSQLHAALVALKHEGLAKKIGVSVYTPRELAKILDRFPVDLVQIPLNILDRSASDSGLLRRLKDEGVEVHVRSVFLQGLLLIDAARRPSYFDRWSTLWDRWHDWLEEKDLTALQACLRFALSHPEVDRVVVGVDSAAQLQEIIDAADGPAPAVPDGLRSTDPSLINPSLWQLT